MRREQLEAQKRQTNSRRPSHSRPLSRAATPIKIFKDGEAQEENDCSPQGQSEDARSQPLQVSQSNGNAQQSCKPKVSEPQLCPPPPTLPPPTLNHSNRHIADSVQANARTIGVEPAASGVQPSNITSAIRSQIISSTASAPFSRAGTIKEVHGLKRKVLEKNAGPALTSVQGRVILDLNNGRAEAQISKAKRDRMQSREGMAQIGEESAQTEEDEDVWLAEDVRVTKVATNKEQCHSCKREAKPGYCENCREKYDDFDEVRARQR